MNSAEAGKFEKLQVLLERFLLGNDATGSTPWYGRLLHSARPSGSRLPGGTLAGGKEEEDIANKNLPDDFQCAIFGLKDLCTKQSSPGGEGGRACMKSVPALPSTM